MFHVEQGDNPLSHGLRRASSPKGTPLRYAGNFMPPPKAVPLGKVASPQAMTEGVTSAQAYFALQPKPSRHAKGPIPEGAVCAADWGSFGRYPLSHGLRRASSPKGTPLRYAGNLIATTKSRPLGEGGIAADDDGRGNFHFPTLKS